MAAHNGDEPRILITTSWDDGHPLDLRTAALLARHGVRGTFYVPVECGRRPVMGADGMRELLAMGMEIGSHTLTHPVLTRIAEAAVFAELEGSKKRLEDALGRAVRSVCYPKGAFNGKVRGQAIRAGYELARTTMAYHTELAFDAMAMPVSCQFVRHRLDQTVRQSVREGNWRGLADWSSVYRMERDPVRLGERMFRRVAERGGMFHLWGHSWELEGRGLWAEFEELLEKIAGAPGAWYLTNTEVLEAREAVAAAGGSGGPGSGVGAGRER